MLNFESTTIGTYGSAMIPCDILTYHNLDGSTWYVVEGSVNVNRTFDDINPGTNVEQLADVECFTAGSPIYSIEDLTYWVEY